MMSTSSASIAQAIGGLTAMVMLGVLLASAGTADAVAVGNRIVRKPRATAVVTDAKQLNPSLTSFDDYCPNGYIAYNKFNTSTGVFDCAIKTAEICFALCDTVASGNWDITNPTDILDPTEQAGWYCRALPGYPTRPCYFKPKQDILHDVANMLSQFQGTRTA